MVERLAKGANTRLAISAAALHNGYKDVQPVERTQKIVHPKITKEPRNGLNEINWGKPPARIKTPSLPVTGSNGKTVRLSGREAQILGIIAQGHTNQSASDELFVSRRTVEFHLANAYKKLGVSNRIQAILAASKLGLIPAEPAFDSDWKENNGLLRELVSDCPEQRVPRREPVGEYAVTQSAGGTS